MLAKQKPKLIVSHSKRVLDIALRFGWEAGARYTNLRDVQHLNELYFLDIDWKRYDFEKHLWAAAKTSPNLTVARDLTSADDLDDVILEAEKLMKFVNQVILVPKDPALKDLVRLGVPKMFRLGYSVPTKYGKTDIESVHFAGEVHLLGGRPDTQRELANHMNVKSVDGNRFTLDAKFGDYFDGDTFRPHPIGGYDKCIEDSIKSISNLWQKSEAQL